MTNELTNNTITSQIAITKATEERCPESSWRELGRRCTVVALPFLSLYRPLGKVISYGLGSVNLLSSAANCTQKISLQSAAKLGLAIVGLATLAFSLTVGTILLTLTDLGTHFYSASQQLKNGEWANLFDSTLQIGIGVLNLIALGSGGPAFLILLMLLQGSVEAFRSGRDFKEGKWIEAFGHIAMASVRAYQGKAQYTFLQRKNQLIALQQKKAQFHGFETAKKEYRESINENGKLTAYFKTRLQETKESSFLKETPFYHLEEAYAKNRLELHGTDFGAHFHGYGGSIVKGQNLSLIKIREEEKTLLQLNFAVNPQCIDRFHSLFSFTTDYQEAEVAAALQEALLDLGMTPAIHHTNYGYPSSEGIDPFGKSTYFHNFYDWSSGFVIEGLGAIHIGQINDTKSLGQSPTSMIPRIAISVEEGEDQGEKLHLLLSLFGLGDVLKPSTDEEMEKLLLTSLFELLFPREAFSLKAEFFDLGFEDLKQQIIAIKPQMAEHIANDLPRMTPLAIYPGQYRWTLPEFKQLAADKGLKAVALRPRFWDFPKIDSLFKYGLLSAKAKENLLKKPYFGRSAYEICSGELEHVSARLITQADVDREAPLLRENRFSTPDQMQITVLIDPAVLALEHDSKLLVVRDGMDRNPLLRSFKEFKAEIAPDATGKAVHLLKQQYEMYKNAHFTSHQNSLFETLDAMNAMHSLYPEANYSRNAVALAERIDPSYIQKIIVTSEEERAVLLNHLSNEGISLHNGQSLQDLIQVGDHLTEDLIQSQERAYKEEEALSESIQAFMKRRSEAIQN